jgi:hypothetical protein
VAPLHLPGTAQGSISGLECSRPLAQDRAHWCLRGGCGANSQPNERCACLCPAWRPTLFDSKPVRQAWLLARRLGEPPQAIHRGGSGNAPPPRDYICSRVYQFYRVVVLGKPAASPVAAAGKLCGYVEKPVASPPKLVRVHRLVGPCYHPCTTCTPLEETSPQRKPTHLNQQITSVTGAELSNRHGQWRPCPRGIHSLFNGPPA